MPFQHFHGRGFTFIRNSSNRYFVRFKDDDLLLISTFNYDEADYDMDNYYRDFNLIFTFDWKRNYQWFGTHSMVIYHTRNEIVTKTNDFHVNKFYEDWFISLKGTQYVVGTSAERNKLNLQGRSFLISFVKRVKYVDNEINELFYTCRRHFKGKDSILNGCKLQKVITLNSSALRELNAIYPNFILSQLDCWKVETPFIRRWGKDDLILFPKTKNSCYCKTEFNYSEFLYNDRKYNPWLKSSKYIFNRPTYQILPGTIKMLYVKWE